MNCDGLDRVACVAIAQRDLERAVRNRVAGCIPMTARRKRHGLIQHRAHALDHLAAAKGVVVRAARQFSGFLDGIGAIEGIVKTAPAGIGGIERVTRIAERHHQLRAREPGDLGVHVLRADLEVRPLRNQVARPDQVRFVGRDIERLPAPRAMPVVDVELQLVAPREQRLVDRHELIQQRGEPDPEARGVQSQLGTRDPVRSAAPARWPLAVRRARSSQYS